MIPLMPSPEISRTNCVEANTARLCEKFDSAALNSPILAPLHADPQIRSQTTITTHAQRSRRKYARS